MEETGREEADPPIRNYVVIVILSVRSFTRMEEHVGIPGDIHQIGSLLAE